MVCGTIVFISALASHTGPMASTAYAASKAALNVYEAIKRDGTQANVVDTMQTRAELYEHLNYHDFEQKLDKLFSQDK